MTQDPWILFMQNKLAPHGQLLSDIQAYTSDELELHHNYIQWIFPICEPSKVNPEAPLLQPIHCEVIQLSKGVRRDIGKNLDLMLNHWGLKRKGALIDRGDNFATNSVYWRVPIEHNHLRITRVLTFLRLTGFPEVAASLYDCLYQELLLEVLTDIGAMSYWDDALKLKPLV